MKKIFTLLTIITATVGWVNAQTTLTLPISSPYSQNFNTTPGAAGTTYPTGWGSYNQASTFDGTMATGTSSSTTGGNYNFTSNIGLLGSGSAFVPSSIVLAIGHTFLGTSFKISYNVTKVREQGRSNSFNLEYSTTSATSGFTAVAGGTYESGIIAEGTSTNYSNIDISAIDNSSSTVYLRWNYTEISGSGSRDGIALDDISITWSGTLPISLIKFTADEISEKVKLNWVTATEINNDKFIIERSADGENFELVSEVKGAGNSREINSYNVVDATPLKGTSYYRLTQVDFNGASETFAPVAVNMTGKLSLTSVNSNTEAGNIDLNIYSPSATSTSIRVTDLSGRTIASQQVNLVEGYQSVNINTNNLSSGIHIIQIMNGEEVVMKKLVL
jgi:hypothetical protein